MSVSVIIPTCGRPNLEYTVASVLRELRPNEGDQLIVVGPRKPEIIKPCYDIRDDLIWIKHDNGGYDPTNMKSRNNGPGYPSGGEERDIGRAAATGSHIMVIDDDDIFIEGAFMGVRLAIETDPLAIHIFRVRYGCTKQWRSPHAKNLRAGWNRGIDEHEWVLWGDPLLILGNVGAMMCLFPNSPDLKWDCSDPSGAKNKNEDFWVVSNYVHQTKRRPEFNTNVIGIIKPTPAELGHALSIEPPPIRYAPQAGIWDGTP
jgi:hypothetical protein